MKNFLLIFLFFCSTLSLSAQDPFLDNIMKLPSVPDMNNPSGIPNLPGVININNQTAIQNQRIINESMAEMIRQREKREREEAVKELLAHGFKSWSLRDSVGTSFFHQAFEEISQMLRGEQALNLGRAVFLIENAAYGNTLNYVDYQNFIQSKVSLCQQKAKEEKLKLSNNTVKNLMLFRLISDTLKFKNMNGEKGGTHFPVRYNYDDFNSKKYRDSHFVTKLMQSGEGQCYSMPLYYLILAEAMDTEASWAFSPHHSFVKIQDENRTWHNLELTCGAVLSDAHYMNIGYVKAEAIRKHLFLEPLNKTQAVAELLLNLARYYHSKYGLDDFYLQCINTAEPYLLNNLNALMLKSIYEAKLTSRLAYWLDAKTPETLKQKSPEAYQHYERMHDLYRQIDDMGYEEIPEELYVTWMGYMEKQRQTPDKNRHLLLNEKK